MPNINSVEVCDTKLKKNICRTFVKLLLNQPQFEALYLNKTKQVKKIVLNFFCSL